MLELAVLGVLREQELHGYELKKRLGETFGRTSGVSFGSLYPALSRLEKAGAVVALAPEGRPGREAKAIPSTGSIGGELAVFKARKATSRPPRGGRSRKVYRVTESGQALFEELLATESRSGDDDRLFNLRLAFARFLPADARLGMLERRKTYLVDRLANLRARNAPGQSRLDAYTGSVLEHDRQVTKHDLDWIEGLIASERSGNAVGTRSAIADPNRRETK